MLKPVDLSAALQDGTVARRPVNNMFKSLRTVIHPQLRLGSSNRTQYVEFWEQTRDAMLGDISNAMWNSPEVPFPAILNMLKYRYGVLWNKKIAYRFGSPYLIGLDTHPAKNWACPLCGEEDSGGHILGGCKNADIVGLKILRHDDTVIAIGRTILHGNEGAWYTLMDAGKREDNNDVAEETRIPPFILPNIDDVTRGKLRPDILRVRNLDKGQVAPLTPDERKLYDIDVVEVGFCSDTQYAAKITEKTAQHADLLAALKAAGCYWRHVKLHIFTFGNGGTTYKHNLKALLEMGVTDSKARKCLTKIHTASITRGHQMVTTRRWQERQPLLASRRTHTADTEGT